MTDKIIVTITGPSASGKSVLEKMLVETGDFYKTVSTTTREPRNGEAEGEDYFFVSFEDFVAKQKNGDFIEAVYFNGNGYSVDRAEIDRAFEADKHVAIVCEPNGAKQIKRYGEEHGIKVLSLFVTNDEETLLKRFVAREFIGLMDAGQIRYKNSRLTNLIEDEMKWIDRMGWDVVIEYFNELNQADVVAFIQNHANFKGRDAMFRDPLKQVV